MIIKKQHKKTNFLKKLQTHFLIALTLFFTVQTPLAAWVGEKPSSTYIFPPDRTVEDIIVKTYHSLHILDKPSRKLQTPTLAYLNRTDLRAQLNTEYSNAIKDIGIDYFSDVFKKIITNEIDFKDTHYVFYHAQMREFALLQDLYKELNKINTRDLCKKFKMLRVPHKDFSKFKDAHDFLFYHIKNKQIRVRKPISVFDYVTDDIRKRLLSVNPSLFSNTKRWAECSFYYFLHSQSWHPVNIITIIQDLFDAFDYAKYFKKYKPEIEELNKMLSKAEKGKTGILLQIFIPKKQVNSIAYRCVNGGGLYHTDEKPKDHPVNIDLENYIYNSTHWNTWDFNCTEFRLVINQTMLNPNSGIKFFRYYNRTNTMKKYKEKLKNLCANIAADVKAER
ncbi:MAG: hypothetical protein ABH827_04250 [bacterium]